MKYVSFRIIAMCILLPPICYGFTVQGLEYYLDQKYTRDVEEICVGDTGPLLLGTVRLKNAIRANVDRYLQHQKLLSWGVTATVWVTSGSQRILYPVPVTEAGASLLSDNAPEIASENYSLLHDGLAVSVDVKLEFNRLLPNAVLGVYVLLAIISLYGVYRRGVQKTNQEEAELNEKLNRLVQQEQAFSSRLAGLKEERERVSSDRDRLKKTLETERRKAGSNEAELFDEIVQLDEKLTKNLLLQQEQQAEIESLSEKIRDYEKEYQKTRAPKTREADTLAKRFATLYKNISVHGRAVEGFTALPEEMKIKGEEIIHRLNEAPDQVPIKRKVFSRKGRETVLEVLFSYNGRLYFRRSKDQQIEILTVGNKNTQSKDLEYINKVSRK